MNILYALRRARMTRFKCPTSVDFVDSLPKGGTGKLQKNVLRARFAGAQTMAANRRD